MKKTLILPALLICSVFFAMVSCKKDQAASNVVKLSRTDTGKLTTVQKGKIIEITLGNPGDGGYQFNNWQYDTTVLRLTTHIHTPAADSKLVGNFGTDTWQFTTVASGTTSMLITASRGQAGGVNMFRGTIKVE